MSEQQTKPRASLESAKRSTAHQGIFDRALCWAKENWNEDSNLGKAKLATVAVLAFMFVLTLWPTRDAERDAGLAIQAKVDIPAPPALQSEQAAETAQGDGAGIAALAAEKNKPVQQLTGHQAETGDENFAEAEQQARQVYDEYESRIAQLSADNRVLEDSAPQTEQALQSATEQASEAYTNYEERVAMLEMENRTLTRQLEDARTALEQTQQELAGLKQDLGQARSEPAPPTAVEELGQEMKQQLESLQSLIDRLLQGADNEKSTEPAQVQPL